MKRIILFLAIGIILSGCNLFNDSPEAVLSEVSENLDEVNAIEASFSNDHEEEDFVEEGSFQFDYGNDKYWYELEDPLMIGYKEGDAFELFNEGYYPVGDDSNKEILQMNITQEIEAQQNILEYFKTFDEDLFEKFDVEEKEETLIFTYNGDEEEQINLVETFINKQDEKVKENLSDDYIGDDTPDDVIGEKFKASFTIDKESYLIDESTIKVVYARDREDGEEKSSTEIATTYENYDDISGIEEVDIDEIADIRASHDFSNNEPDLDESFNDVDLDNEDQEAYEEEAMDYLEAMIQATVFQNAEKYAEVVPGPGSDDEKLEQGETEVEQFREIYIQNTESNMGSFEVSDEAIENLADSFLGAMEQTKYEIEEAEADSETEISVTITVQGINDGAVYEEVEQELAKEAEEGEIKEEDIAERNIEILADTYSDVDDISDELTYDVTIFRTGDGTYEVVQDEYLEGFVVY